MNFFTFHSFSFYFIEFSFFPNSYLKNYQKYLKLLNKKMDEIGNFLRNSKMLIKRKIVQFSFSTDDLESYDCSFKKIETFLFDPDLNESKEIESFEDHLGIKKKYFDHFVFSEIIYEDRRKLNQFFMNFIKENVFSPLLKPITTKRRGNRLRSYSFQDYNAEKFVNLYTFSHLLKVSMKKVSLFFHFSHYNILGFFYKFQCFFSMKAMWEITIFLRELREIYRKNSIANPFYETNVISFKNTTFYK